MPRGLRIRSPVLFQTEPASAFISKVAVKRPEAHPQIEALRRKEARTTGTCVEPR
jgi:hypothetical protein